MPRMLDNEKYAGRWVWNKTATRRDPHTGKRRRFQKPKSEWIIHEDDEFRIVPQELWERVRARRQEVSKAWPGGEGRRGFSRDRQGQQPHFSTHLLSRAMECGKCGKCGAMIAQVSGIGPAPARRARRVSGANSLRPDPGFGRNPDRP